MKTSNLLSLALFGLYLLLFHSAQAKAQADSPLQGPVYSLRELDAPYMMGTIVNIAMVKVENMTPPVVSKKERKRGEVSVQVVITQEGKMVNPTIVKSLGKAYDEEVMRVMGILQSKLWEAGLKDGKPVNVLLNLPFEFTKKG